MTKQKEFNWKDKAICFVESLAKCVDIGYPFGIGVSTRCVVDAFEKCTKNRTFNSPIDTPV